MKNTIIRKKEMARRFLAMLLIAVECFSLAAMGTPASYAEESIEADKFEQLAAFTESIAADGQQNQENAISEERLDSVPVQAETAPSGETQTVAGETRLDADSSFIPAQTEAILKIPAGDVENESPTANETIETYVDDEDEQDAENESKSGTDPAFIGALNWAFDFGDMEAAVIYDGGEELPENIAPALYRARLNYHPDEIPFEDTLVLFPDEKENTVTALQGDLGLEQDDLLLRADVLELRFTENDETVNADLPVEVELRFKDLSESMASYVSAIALDGPFAGMPLAVGEAENGVAVLRFYTLCPTRIALCVSAKLVYTCYDTGWRFNIYAPVGVTPTGTKLELDVPGYEMQGAWQFDYPGLLLSVSPDAESWETVHADASLHILTDGMFGENQVYADVFTASLLTLGTGNGFAMLAPSAFEEDSAAERNDEEGSEILNADFGTEFELEDNLSDGSFGEDNITEQMTAPDTESENINPFADAENVETLIGPKLEADDEVQDSTWEDAAAEAGDTAESEDAGNTDTVETNNTDEGANAGDTDAEADNTAEGENTGDSAAETDDIDEDEEIRTVTDGMVSTVLPKGISLKAENLSGTDQWQSFNPQTWSGSQPALSRKQTTAKPDSLLKGNYLFSVSSVQTFNAAPDEADASDTYRVLAVYDISLSRGGEEYQPENGAVEVVITDPAISEELSEQLEIWHIHDDNSIEQILDFTVEGNSVRLLADSFSVYIVVDHEGGEVKNPRVEFHFIDRYTDEQYEEGINVTQATSAPPYNFPNRKDSGDGYQMTQILKNGETLDLINDPANISVSGSEKFFFGWYVVDMVSDSSILGADGKYTGSISFNWPNSPDQIHFEQAISITANDVNGDGKITVPNHNDSTDGDTVTWSLSGVSGTAPIDRDGNAHVYLAPLYEDFFFLNFNKLPRDLYTASAETLMTRKLVVFGSGTSASVRIGNVMCESPDPTHRVFSGWEMENGQGGYEFHQTVEHVLDENGNLTNREKDSGAGSGGYYITVTKPDNVSFIELFPRFDEARWLYFNTGKSGNGATYVGAAYRLTNDSRGSADNEFYYFDKAFFTGSASTAAHLSSRPGYNFTDWYLFANIDGETGEITNLTTPQTIEVSFLDENSNPHTATINTTAIQVVDADGVIQDVGSWYVTPSYTGSEITGGVISTSGSINLFEVLGDTADTRTLRFYKAMDDMTFYAKWESGTVNYTVVYWLENANDNDYTLMYYKTMSGVAGTQTAAAATSASDTFVRDGVTHYPYTEYKLAFAHLSADQDKDTAGNQGNIQQETINGDGSTIINVYYDRNRYTLRFDIGYSYKRNGQTTYYVSGINNSSNYNQFLTSNGISCGTTIPDDFIPCGTYIERNGGNDYTIYYYDLTAKYGESIADRWPDTQPDRSNSYGFIGWIAREDSYYWHNIAQSSLKGDYEAMDEGVIYVGPRNNYTATTAENGIAHEFRCRYQQNTNKYVYRVSFWDPELPGTGFPSSPDLEMKVNSAGAPRYRAVAAYTGYTEPSDVVVKLVKGNENGNEVNLPSDSNEGYSSYYVTSVGYNAMIINFYYRPNQHSVSYKYGAGSPKVGTEFDTASKSYYYKQSLADANVNQDAAVADTPQGYSFVGWYDNAEGVGSVFNFNTTMPDGDIILYAVYKPIRYRVMIDPNGGEVDHINHNYNNGSADPAMRGYSGYWWDADGNAVSYASGSGVIPFATFNRAAISGERQADIGYNRSKSTYIIAYYGETISEYTTERRYVPITDAAAAQYEASGGTVYYYMNAQYKETDGSGLPSDCRNALYVTETEIPQYYQFYRDWTKGNIDGGYVTGTVLLDYNTWKALYVSAQKYRACNGNETWTFLGWFKTGESMPYNFSDPVSGDFSLTAHWRLDGGYSIQYIPKYTMDDGAVINGTMTSWRDPSEAYISYADGAETQIYKAPTGLKKDDVEITDDSVIFRGWALVSKTGSDTDPVYTPLEKDSNGNITTYYLPSDAYTVNAANAGTDSTIYFQAVYQYREHSDRRPGIANLILDANTGFVDNSSALPVWDYPGVSEINTADHLTTDGKPTQILFGDIQSNAAVHLYRYATELTEDAQGQSVSDAHQFFENSNGHFLLGFDESPTEGDYTATYPADSVIAITRTDAKTLYAVWEPMVYVTFVNNTGVTQNDLKFGLSSSLDVLQVINAADGLYDRKPINDYNNITLKNGESITLAFPFGAEQTLTISGTNTLGVGKKLIWNSSIDLVTGSGTESYTTVGSTSNTVTYPHGDHSHDLVSGEVNNTKPFSFTETMIENANALTVTFTSANNDYALLLDDNYEGGGMQEIDYATADIKPENGTPRTQVLPTTSTRIGYSFIGWAYDPNATTPDFSADKPAGSPWTILDLDNENGGFFSQTVEIDNVQTRTLYGVWEAKTDAIYVFKEVPEPGNPEQAFTFTMAITGNYHAASGSNTTINVSEAFKLKHGEYLKINSTNNNATASGNQTAYVQSVVEVYKQVTDSEGTTSYVKDTGRSKTVRWQKAVSVSSHNSFESLKLSVTEDSVTYYDTSVRLSSQTSDRVLRLGTNTFDNSQLPQTVATNTVSWVNTDDGGTVVFVNQRQTFDVTVSKSLTSNSSASAVFNYSASYADTFVNLDGQTVTKTKTLDDFTVTSGSYEMLEDLPAGVSLTITEATDANNNYDTYVSIDDAAEQTSKNTGAFSVASDHAVAFRNVLKSYPVTFKLVDQDGNTTINGMFALASSLGSLGSDLYASASSTEPPAGVFYTSDKFWADTYTLTQTIIPTGYLGLSDPVTISVTGNGINSSDENVTISGNATDGYEIAVTNWKTVDITLKAGLLDPLVSQRTFFFTGTYQFKGNTYDLNRNLLGDGGTPTIITLTAVSTNTGEVAPNFVPRTVKIPVGATELTIWEDTTQITTAPDTIATTYDTTVVRRYIDHADGDKVKEAAKVNGTRYIYRAPDGITPTAIPAENDGDTIIFSNTRKTVDITVKKRIEGYDPSEPDNTYFSFTATLRSGAIPITDYFIDLNGTPNDTSDDGKTGTESGKEGQYVFYLQHNGAKILTVPIGVRLSISETGASSTDEHSEDLDLAAYTLTVDAVVNSSSEKYTAGTFTEEDKRYDLNPVPSTALTVTFTNNPGGGGRKVILRQVLADDYTSSAGRSFTVYKGSSQTAYKIKHEDGTEETLENLQSTASGVFWIGTLPYGEYAIEEDNSKWFTMTIGDDTSEGSRDGVVISGELSSDPRIHP